MRLAWTLCLACTSTLCLLPAMAESTSAWDGTQWPQPVQQAFVEALVWDHACWHPGDEAATERATKQAEVHLERAFDLAKEESPRCYAEALTAAAECSLSSTRYISDFREAAFGFVESEQKAAKLRKIEGMLDGAGSEQAKKLIEQMRLDAELEAEAATESSLESMRILLGGYSASHIQWCIAAIAADPTFVPAWERLAMDAEGETATMARREWQRLVPDNATPWICEADEQRRREHFAEAAALLKRASALDAVTYHELKLPNFEQVAYPDLDLYSAAKVVGQPVPRAAIANMAAGSGLSRSSPSVRLRNLYFTFRIPTDQELEEGSADEPPDMADGVRCRALSAILRLDAIGADSGPPDAVETMSHRYTISSTMREMLNQKCPIEEEQVQAIENVLLRIHHCLHDAIDKIKSLTPTDEDEKLRSEYDGSIDRNGIWREAVLKSREEQKLLPLIDELLGR